MMKNKVAWRFFGMLTVLLAIAFALHAWIQHQLKIGSFERLIILNYSFNYLLTLFFFVVLIYFQERRKGQLGYVFLFSSLFKFLLFFLLIYPGMEESPGVKSASFASFFVPYAISLTAETTYLVRWLNRN